VRGLVWKELREWGPAAAALLVLLCLGWCLAAPARDVLLAPNLEPTLFVLATASLCGLALGYAQLGLERTRGALAYLAHREGGRHALLRGKLAVGAPLALALGVLPPLVYLAQQSSGTLAPILMPERALEHALAGFVALPAYACGLLVALIAPSSFLRFALGLLAAVGCFLYSAWLPLPVRALSAWSEPLFVLGELALAAAVLRLVWRLFARSHDRDLVLPLRLQVGSALCALLFVVFPGWSAFSNSVREGQRSLFDEYPLVVRSFDGRYSAMERSEYYARAQDPRTPKRTFTMPDGTLANETDPVLVYNPAPPPEVRLRTGAPFADPQRWSMLGLRSSDGHHVCYLDREQGVVHEFRDLDGKLSPPTHTVLRRDDGRPFSRETLIAGGGDNQVLLVDGADHTLWKLEVDGGALRLEPEALPDGDALVGVALPEIWEPEGWSAELGSGPVLVGARGRYVSTYGGFQREGSPAAKPWWMRYCRSEVGEASLVSSTVRLRAIDASGASGPESEVLFVQRYEPRTLRQIGRVALMRFGLLCGPPVLSAQRLLGDSNTPLLRGILPGPTPMPRDAAWLHLAHALLGLAFGVLTWRHIARRGGTRAERVLWSAFAALFGVFALTFLRMLAPRPEPVAALARRESAPLAPVSPFAATQGAGR
jgi:hypothetical protein